VTVAPPVAPPASPQVAAVPPPAAPASGPFDGTWFTTLECKTGSGGRAFTYRFLGQVKDSRFSGEQGTDGQPSWFRLEGKIQPDGSAAMLAVGIVGNSTFAAGRVATGTRYNYPVSAHFDGSKGTGERSDHKRVCTVEFVKQ
jgi:hypothetical protein